MQKVTHEGQVHTFPDEATPEMISSALNVSYGGDNQSSQEGNTESKNIPLPLQFAMSLKKPFSQSLPERNQAVKRGLQDIPEGLKQLFLSGKEKLGYGKPGELEDYTNKIQKEREEYDKSSGGQDILSKLLRGGVSNIPEMLMGGAGGVLGKAGLKSMLGAGIGTGLGAGTQFIPKDESRLSHMIKEGGIASLIPGVPHIPDAASAMTPSSIASKLIKSPHGEKELSRNLEAASGSATGLGDIVGSAGMKRIQENVISKIPWTGAEGALNKTGKEIFNRGEDIVNKYLGKNDPLEISEQLGESLNNAYKTQSKAKNSLYKDSESIAEKSNFTPKLEKFDELMREHADGLLNSNIFQFEPKVKNIIQQLVQGNNATNLTLKEANIMSGKLRELSKQYGATGDISSRNASRILGDISKALKSDIKNSISETGNKELISSFDAAEKNYKKQFSPFLDKAVMSFTSGKKLPEDLVSSFLKTSNTSDKAVRLQKLFKVIPEKDQDLVRYAYLSRALQGSEGMKSINPNKLKTLWTKLGDNQKKTLIPDASHRRQLDNYVRLVDMNPKAVNKMFNPQTGQMNSDLITAYMFMNPGKSLKEIVWGMIGNRVNTSEKFRNKVVSKMIERKRKENK